MLGIDSCTNALEVNIHKTIRRIECSHYCCGLSSSYFYGTEELQIFDVNFAKPQLLISLANRCRFSLNFPYQLLGYSLRERH